MRFLRLNLLVGALLLLGAADASAFGVFLTSNHSQLSVSSTVTVTVHIDFEGGTNDGINFLGVGVRFDNGILSYSQAASQTSTYLLYSAATGATPMSLLVPGGDCALGGCGLWGGGGLAAGESQVNIDWYEPAFRNTTSNFLGGVHGDVLATLVFHVAAVGDGIAEIDIVLDLATGGIYSDLNGINRALPNLSGSFTLLPPEPPSCGDGFIDAGEEGDDWGDESDPPGDGCHLCEIETGWTCVGEPSVCSENCGDGVVVGTEECDDGNTTDGDCCSSSCDYEASGSSCDDGDACTDVDTCNGAGTCDAGSPLVCDDDLF